MNTRLLPVAFLSLAACALLSGCSTSIPRTGSSEFAAAITGVVHGGQQPVSGATIQLYTVNTTTDGGTSTPLLTKIVTTDTSGGFTLTNLYSCSSATYVYITATGGSPGGSPGGSTANPNLALMTSLGPCSSLTASTSISINELTTVAAVSSLAPFMTSLNAVGSNSTDLSAMQNAFTASSQLVNPSTGISPGVLPSPSPTIPTAQINTLGNILAACVNSNGGAAGDSSICGQLFTLTTPSGGASPTDTIAAMLNIANNPALNTAALFALPPANPPFQPQLTAAPTDFSVSARSPAALTLGANALVFSSTGVGYTSLPLTVTVANPNSYFQANGVTVEGVNKSDFTQTSNCPQSNILNATCTIQVTFKPSAAGIRTAALMLVANSYPNYSVQTITLSGAAVNNGAPSAGPITLSTTSITYNYQYSLADVVISNQGTTPLHFVGVSFTIPAYAAPEFALYGNTCGAVLAPQSVCTLTVQSLAYNTTNYTYGTMTIDDDAAAGPQTVSLTASASLSIASPVYSFGTWPVNESVPGGAITFLTSTVPGSQNTGTLGGANPGDFSVSPGGCYFNGTGSCSLQVTFTPSATGLRTAKYALVGGSGYMLLTGNGAPAGPSLSTTLSSQGPAYLDQYGVASFTGYLTAVNNGTTTLNLALSTSGQYASDYAVTGNGFCPSLAPLATCSVNIAFTSNTPGTFPANVILKDTSSTYSLTVPVAFQAAYPAVGVQPSNPVTFPVQTAGTTSAPLTFSVSNGSRSGSVPLGHPISISGSENTDFTYPLGTTCPASTTAICTLSIAFSPKSTGSFTDILTITDLTSGNTASVYYFGTAGVPGISLSPSTLTFPSRAIGTTSIPMVTTLTNSGTVPLIISTVSISGAVNNNFTQTNTCAGTTLAANGTCSISASFAPTAIGTQGASIQILSNAASSPDTITLSGTAQ